MEMSNLTILKKEREHDTFISLARDIANKSKCTKRQVGAIIVKDGKILATGYNGVPYEMLDCSRENLCIKNSSNSCRALCAEQIAITEASGKGVKIAGAKIYITHSPCIRCAMAIVVANISEVIYEEEYPDDLALKFLKKAGVAVRKYS